MSKAIDLTPRMRTKARPGADGVDILGAHVGFGMATLVKIANEFGVNKSNEKPATILRGCEKWADLETAQKLEGVQLMIHCKGREFPDLFKMGKTIQAVAADQEVSGETEAFYTDDDLVNHEVREAIRYKMLLKKVLSFCKVIYANAKDQDLVLVEITTQKNGESAIDAIFRGGAEEMDAMLSITEVTNFDFSEDN